MPRKSSSVTVMKCELKKVGFRIRFFANGSRSLNINHRLKIAFFTLFRTKMQEKIIFLWNMYETVNEHQIMWFYNTERINTA